MKKFVTMLLLTVLAVSACFALAGCDDGITFDEGNYEEFVKDNLSNIKNVIVFIGDGMGFNHIANAQTYFDKESVFNYDGNLAGEVTTHSLNNAITDSAAAGTALATGKKVENNRVATYNGEDLQSITTIAKKKGKKTGVITTEYLYGATPASYSSHAAYRKDYDTIVSQQAKSDVDLLIGDCDDEGYYLKYKNDFAKNRYAMTDSFESLLKTPANQKVVANISGLRSKYNSKINNNTVDQSALLNYAFDYLDNKNGFFLMVESAYIDKCSHNNDLTDALCEVRSLSDMINTALAYAENRNDTVIIVTADHETGGLGLAQTKEEIVNFLYTRKNHTDANVPLYVFGYDMGKNKVFDNTDIFKLCKVLVAHNNGKI